MEGSRQWGRSSSPGARITRPWLRVPGAPLSPLRRTGGQDVTGWPANPKLVRHLKSTLIWTGVHVDEAVMGLSVHTDEDGGGDNPQLQLYPPGGGALTGKSPLRRHRPPRCTSPVQSLWVIETYSDNARLPTAVWLPSPFGRRHPPDPMRAMAPWCVCGSPPTPDLAAARHPLSGLDTH